MAKRNCVKRLKTHVLIYKCADMLGIKGLKEMASSRFVKGWSDTLIFDKFDSDILKQPLELMYDATRPDDPGLRLQATSLCVREYAIVEKHPEIVATILRHEPTAWTVAMPLFRKAIFSSKFQEKVIMDYVQKAKNEFRHCCDCRDRSHDPTLYIILEDNKLLRVCEKCVKKHGVREIQSRMEARYELD